MAEDLVVIGRITRTHGVRGEVRVQAFSDSPASLGQYERIYVRRHGGGDELFDVLEFRPHQNAALFKLKGIRTRDEAQTLAGADVLIPRTWLPRLEEDEYYWVDLIGLDGYDRNDRFVGRVENIFSNGADDILVLNLDGREILLPFRAEMILEVDLEGRRLVVHPPEGLLDLSS